MSSNKRKKNGSLPVVRYRNELAVSFVFLGVVFKYLLQNAQELLQFSKIESSWGMWCRVLFCTTDSFWFGASYWIVFCVWIWQMMQRETSRSAIVRYGSKQHWNFCVIKKGISFAVVFPVFHFLWLCVINVILYGWNRPGMETEAFHEIFLNLSFGMAALTSLLARILVSVLSVSVIWTLVLLSRRTLYSAAGYMLYALISCIALAYDIRVYALVFPSGTCFFYLLRDYAKNLILVPEIFIIGMICCYFLQKFFLNKAVMEDFISKNG